MLLALDGCKKPYTPPVVAVNHNYLVVEGVIDPGPDSTIIKLSRTVPVSSAGATVPELNATVAIENDAGTVSYPLTQMGKGYYATAGLNLSSSGKYRLKITTSGGVSYQSDAVAVKNSPPIDSVHFKVETQLGGTLGVQIYVDTHDASNDTRYYRWTFNETYTFHAAYDSHYILDRTPQYDTIVLRRPDQMIYSCWLTDTSSNLLLNSTAALSKDVVSNMPLDFLASTSEKISGRFSILVKQYALTKEAFQYWQQLKKNSQQLGSIFDAQPSEVQGNMHCLSDPSLPVLGYISAGKVALQRIFIDNYYLRIYVPKPDSFPGCLLESQYYVDPITGANDVENNIYRSFWMPVDPISQPGAEHPLGYTTSTEPCIDCTLRGTTKQPSFWTPTE